MVKVVNVLVGAPASGKSTYAKRMTKHNNKVIRLSSDYIREAIPEIADDNAEVFRIMQKALRMHIEDGYFHEVYYDATNINRKRRRALYRNIRSWGKDVQVNIVFFSLPYKTLVERNGERKGSARVPESVVLRMHKDLQVPRLEVDCDSFEVKGVPIFKENYNELENPTTIQSMIRLVNPEWRGEFSLIDTEHNNPWHQEDVPTHINMTIENSESKEMKQVALFHDLGKGICKHVDETGYGTFRGHSEVSAHYFFNYLHLTKYSNVHRIYKGMKYTEAKGNLELLEVIRQHMNMHNEMGDKNIRNNRLTRRILELGKDFAEIDNRSKITDMVREKD